MAQQPALEVAVQLLHSSNGVLQIEDLLPLFPDFVSLKNIKEALVASLESYQVG